MNEMKDAVLWPSEADVYGTSDLVFYYKMLTISAADRHSEFSSFFLSSIFLPVVMTFSGVMSDGESKDPTIYLFLRSRIADVPSVCVYFSLSLCSF